jgi:capsid protein
MNLPRSWKSAFYLLGIVVAAALSGALVGHRIARAQLETRNNPANWNEHVSHEFDRIVKPTPAQGTLIQVHLDKAVRELQAIRLDTITRSTNVIWRLVSEVERELTPEQRRAFEAMKPKPVDLTLDVLKVKEPHSAARPPN